jgi:hypothetical protein
LKEQQLSLALDTAFNTPLAVGLELRDEIATAWSLPLGQRVEVCFNGGARAALAGILELLRAPDYP